MQQQIQEAIKKAGGTWGVFAQYLDDDRVMYEQNAAEVFYAASIAKVYIALYVLRQAEDGTVKLDELLKLHPDHRREGTGVLQHLHEGLEITLKDTLTLMLMLSDNVAALMLVRRFGAKHINDYLESIGLKQTRLEVLDEAKFTFGNSTPAEMAQLLSGAYKHELINEEHARFLLATMGDCHFTAGIRRYLPTKLADGTKLLVANKEGTFEDSRHDVGIVLAKRPYVLTILSKGLADQSYGVENAGVHAIADISKAIYEATV